MHSFSLLLLPLVLALATLVHETHAANVCRAQNILDACLNMQQKQFRSCAYDNWECKCHCQRKVLTCYDNCPDAENRTLQEMQVQIFCAAVNGKEYNSEMMDRMTRPARNLADDIQVVVKTREPAEAEKTKVVANAPKPSLVPSENGLVGDGGDGGSGGGVKGKKPSYRVVNDNSALRICAPSLALVLAAAASLWIPSFAL
ncbi:hypothetical protein LPJ66_000523 [Kickxella alabastrina]|uniref:Uncharacterized protein n=1 Tax=Kickxella alabastrina TaxID=61397 RepID=A0ACC1IVR9_9FUNG|nr:hypothetical protein LPJ66_000523 [Kickxella alabastrina]